MAWDISPVAMFYSIVYQPGSYQYVFAASSSALNTQTKPQPGDQQNEGFAVAQ